MSIKTRTSGIMVNINVEPTAAAYTAQGVRFDGTNDYMELGSGFTGAVDGKVGTVSFWLKMMGGDSATQGILSAEGDTIDGLFIFRNGANQIQIQGNDSAGAINLDLTQSATTTAVGMGWTHFLASWDLAAATAKLYVNDVSGGGAPTTVNSNIDYTRTSWSFGTVFRTIVDILNAEIADFYLNTTTFFDLTNSANRRKFISATGAPVDLGSDGSTPTGSAPLIFLHGPVTGWETNDGTGGGFPLTGTLTAAGSNPP